MPAPRSGMPNLAASAAGWSARHRRRAILGWLAFVLIAYLVGGAVGQRYLTQAEMGNGESGKAAQIVSDAFPKQASEQVLVQGRLGVRTTSPAFVATVQDLVGRLRQLRYVSNVRSPLLSANRGQISRDGRSALVTFTLAGDESQAQKRVVGPLATVARPSERIRQHASRSSARRARPAPSTSPSATTSARPSSRRCRSR